MTDDRDTARLGAAYGDLIQCEHLHVDDNPGDSVAKLASVARRHKIKHRLGLLVIDYLQLLSERGGDDRSANRQEQVAAISRALKQLARELDVPLLALSQLSRKCEEREDKRPRMSDLRESGAIEQDADMVIFLHRPEYFDPNDSPGVAEVIVAKNRNGPTTMIRQTFLRAIARFEDAAPYVPPAEQQQAF